jgi:hypothetical protein
LDPRLFLGLGLGLNKNFFILGYGIKKKFFILGYGNISLSLSLKINQAPKTVLQ